MATLDLTQMYEDIEGLKSGDVHAGYADTAEALAEADAEYLLNVNLGTKSTGTGTVVTPGTTNTVGVTGTLQTTNGGTGVDADNFSDLVDKIVAEAGLKIDDTDLPDNAINFTRIIISENEAPSSAKAGTIWVQLLS